MVDFSAAINIMEDIKRLHRLGKWEILLEKYPILRKTLISIRVTNPDLPDNQKTLLQDAIQHFSGIEEKVEKAIEENKTPENVSKLNNIVSRQIDSLLEVLEEIRYQIGR